MKKMSGIRVYFMKASDGVVYRGHLLEIPNIRKVKRDYASDEIETFLLNDNLVLIGVRDAVIMGKLLNRALYDEREEFINILAGNLMVVRYQDNELVSILDEDVELIERLLKPIDHICCGTIFLKASEELPEWKGTFDELFD